MRRIITNHSVQLEDVMPVFGEAGAVEQFEAPCVGIQEPVAVVLHIRFVPRIRRVESLEGTPDRPPRPRKPCPGRR
jgi:hypothetical protein